MVRLYRSITMLLFNNFCDILLNSEGYEPPTCSDSEEEMVDEEVDKKEFDCKKEVTQAANDSDEEKSESIMHLSWALVHSRKPEDVQRGIAMLEDTPFVVKLLMEIFNCEHQRPIAKEGENIPTTVGYYQSAYFPGVSMHLAQILKCPASLPTEPSDDPLTGTSHGNRNKCYASGILYRVGKIFYRSCGAGLGGSFQGFMKKDRPIAFIEFDVEGELLVVGAGHKVHILSFIVQGNSAVTLAVNEAES
ncbi:mitochondrial fission 1 protein A-like protein [Tanacetum coccineum]